MNEQKYLTKRKEYLANQFYYLKNRYVHIKSIVIVKKPMLNYSSLVTVLFVQILNMSSQRYIYG